MPSAVAKGVALLVLFGGVSPAAGQNNVFTNRAALLVARDAWCADPTAAAAIYGPIALWDISQVTDLSFVFCALGLAEQAARLQPGLLELQQRY